MTSEGYKTVVDMRSVAVRPLYGEVVGYCMQCKREPGRWELAFPGSEGLVCCSLCFLYRHPSLVEQRERVDAFAAAVESRLGAKFLRDDTGRLLRAADADRLVGGLVLTQRYQMAWMQK